jgi:hypothetical protein
MGVWSFDPGQTTGFAYLEDNCVLRLGEFKVGDDSVLDSIGEEDGESATTVLYESLHCSPGFNPIGFEVIGAIKYVCRKIHIKPIARSPLYLAGPMLWPTLDAMRKQVKSPHMRDAIYHYSAWNGDPPKFDIAEVKVYRGPTG